MRGGLRGAHGLRGCLGPYVVRLPEHLRHKIRHPPGPPVRPYEHQRNRRGGEVRLLPFSPYAFEIPSGEVECYLDTEALPNELRIKGTDNVVAYFQNGEFSVPFQLDCEELNYKYTFKEIVE